MTEKIETTAYLQIRRKEQSWKREGSVARVTSKPPGVIDPGCVVVKVKVLIPKAAFEPLSPSAVIDVPEEMVQHAVEVLAE